MQEINLLEVFKDMPEYAIMKIRGTFPHYDKGQDIDIVCRDLDKVSKYLSKYFWGGVNYRVMHRGGNHIHFDILNDNCQIELRFDLYSEFISLKLTKDILDQRMDVKYKDREGGDIADIYIASYHQDILIKCWEYYTNGKRKYKDYVKYKDRLDAYTDR